MTGGLKATEIHELAVRFRGHVARAAQYRARAAQYLAAAQAADREADALQEQLVRIARDSQYEVTVTLTEATAPGAPPVGTDTPPVPNKGH